jgi:hypothetical protein
MKCRRNNSFTHFTKYGRRWDFSWKSHSPVTVLRDLYPEFNYVWHGSITARVSAVGIATRYGLDGPGIESLWGRDFPDSSRPALGPHPASYRMVPGGKAAGARRWPPTPSIAEVEGRVELYIYSTPGPSWPVLGWTLPSYVTDGQTNMASTVKKKPGWFCSTDSGSCTFKKETVFTQLA